MNSFSCFTGFSDQFDKYSYKTIDKVGKDYDFKSIMHYDRKAFTKNGLDTISRIDKPNEDFGMFQKTMSRQDIVELNTLYDCQSKYVYNIISGCGAASEFLTSTHCKLSKTKQAYTFTSVKDST